MMLRKLTYLVLFISVLPWIRPDAACAAELTFVADYRDGTNGVDGLKMAYAAAVSPDNKHVYTVGFDDDAVTAFARDNDTGELTFIACYKNGSGGVSGMNGPEHVVVSPDGKHVVVSVLFENRLTVFSRNETSGKLTFVESHKDGQSGVDGLAAAQSAAMDPDGNHVYVAGRDDNAVAVFSRDAGTGALTYVTRYKDGASGVDGLNSVRNVTVSPDGNHVYAAGHDDDAVAVFSRDAGTGALTYVTCYKDGVSGVDGLNSAWTVTVSPDGNHVYAAGFGDDAVAVFSRNDTTGELSFIEQQKDGVSGVDGLNGAYGIVISPDGKRLYATGNGDNALAVFSRDSDTGKLSYIECHKDNQGSVTRMNQPRFPAVSPDNFDVYVPGTGEDAVTVFRAAFFSLAVEISPGGGSVASDPAGIDCSADCSEYFRSGTSVTLTVSADGGYVFDGWSGGGCSGAGTCTVTMDQNRSVKADFYALSQNQDDDTIWSSFTNQGTLKDKIIKTGAVVTGGSVAGTIQSSGTLNSVIVTDGTLVTGGAVSGTIANSGTLADLTILSNAAVTGGSLSGDILNNGTLSDITLGDGTQVVGGMFSGLILNNGTLMDGTLADGAQVTGGTVDGTISGSGMLKDVTLLANAVVTGLTLQGTILGTGTIRDVFLAPGASVTGVTLQGTITGDPSDPPVIHAQIQEDALLTYVIIGSGASLSPNAALGYGVQFETKSLIPEFMDLTPLVTAPADTLEEWHVSDFIDLSSKLIAGSDTSFLDDINILPDMVLYGLNLEQDPSTGSVSLNAGGNPMSFQPTAIRRVSSGTASPGITLEDDNSVVVVTGDLVEITLTPMVRQPGQLFSLLCQACFQSNSISYKSGVVTALFDLKSFTRIKFAPDPLSTPFVQDPDLPVQDPPFIRVSAHPDISNVSLFSMVYEQDAVLWEQVFYPAPVDAASLKTKLSLVPGVQTPITLHGSGTIETVMNGMVFKGLLDYFTTPASDGLSGAMEIIVVPDRNNDGIDDYWLVYPDGTGQNMYGYP